MHRLNILQFEGAERISRRIDRRSMLWHMPWRPLSMRWSPRGRSVQSAPWHDYLLLHEDAPLRALFYVMIKGSIAPYGCLALVPQSRVSTWATSHKRSHKTEWYLSVTGFEKPKEQGAMVEWVIRIHGDVAEAHRCEHQIRHTLQALSTAHASAPTLAAETTPQIRTFPGEHLHDWGAIEERYNIMLATLDICTLADTLPSPCDTLLSSAKSSAPVAQTSP
ncbi:hypothetical protein MVES_001683 [Malassezia vespertilionis]|uniref:Uncharacterized protein n=1 Tax=Malassezia vespertilionis TaxID=2020962 RepID=A0A2N1JDH2_9BASI|nr:hypothetical protein MVES_001683 [Malassezia vespertilionis]